MSSSKLFEYPFIYIHFWMDFFHGCNDQSLRWDRRCLPPLKIHFENAPDARIGPELNQICMIVLSWWSPRAFWECFEVTSLLSSENLVPSYRKRLMGISKQQIQIDHFWRVLSLCITPLAQYPQDYLSWKHDIRRPETWNQKGNKIFWGSPVSHTY